MKKISAPLYGLIVLAVVLTGLLSILSSHQVAHAQSECTDPATGLPCAPTAGPTCGVPGAPPCEPSPPSCGVAGMPPCEPPPSKPDPTRTPRPRPTRTPTPTAIISCDTNYLTAVLTGANEVPAVRTEGQGTVKLFLDVKNGTITGNWQVSNLSGLITDAHIHDGPFGVKAGVFIPFSGLPLGGSFATVDKASAAKMQATLDDPSHFYVNVHSTTYPGGEIRGQLACAPAEPISSPTPVSAPTATGTAISLPSPSPTPKPIFTIKNSPLDIFKPASVVKPFLQSDIEIVKIEITQAIQCLENATCPDNSVPLFAGKPTMVRAYVRLSPGAYTSVSNIGGRICLGKKGQSGCGKLAVASSSINSLNKVTVVKGAHPRSDRADLNATINFLLPPSWVKNPSVVKTFIMPGKPLELTVYVNYMQKDYPFELKYDNNFKEYRFDIHQSMPVAINFKPVFTNGTQPVINEYWNIVDWLRAVYPTSNFVPYTAISPMVWNTDWNGWCGGWYGLMARLAVARSFDTRIWYGMVDKSAATAQTSGVGCGWNPISVSGGFVGYGNRTTAQIAAKAVGVVLRRQTPPGCGVTNRDPFYPKPDGTIDEVGVDVLRRQLYLSYMSYDYMGTCGQENNTWTSKYTYLGLLNYLPAGYGARPGMKLATLIIPQITQQPMMVGSGLVSPESITMVSGFYFMESSQSLPQEEGPYTVEMLDKSGNTLFSQSFKPVVNGVDDEQGDEGFFMLSIPWSDDAQLIQFKYQNSVIGEVKASQNAPVVEITSTGPEIWPDSGPATITWSASDRDGDLLTSQLEYSNDGGETWTNIAESIPGTSLEVDTAFFPGGEQALIRVIVTDGFNSATAVSVPFQVGDKTPMVHISWPQEGMQVNEGIPLYFQALGIDQEDGVLNLDSLEWTSDRDGSLGSGDLLLDSLSEGEHMLQLLGRDSAGHESKSQVSITVLPAEPAQESEATLDANIERTVNYIAIGAAVFMLVVAALLGVLVVVWRRS